MRVTAGHESLVDHQRRAFLELAGRLAATVPLGLLGPGAVRAGTLFAGQAEADRRLALPHGSVAGLAALIRNRTVSSHELVSACLARIEEVNAPLNAVVLLSAERALREAADADAAMARHEAGGPLHGVPMTVSDSFDIAGVLSTGGTLGRKTHIASRDATVVARLRRAGAVLLGRTNVGELSLMARTDNLVHGRTRNPYDPARSPGGSAGGAAAIVAAGASPFDLAGDLVGGVRVPAHRCGVAAVKPTHGRVPRTGHILPYGGLCDPCHQIGLVARWIDDLALLLPIVAGPDFRDAATIPVPLRSPAAVDLKSLRLAWYVEDASGGMPDPAVADTVREAVGAIESSVRSVNEECPRDIMREADEVRARYEGADDRAWVKRLLGTWGTTNSHPGLPVAGDLVTAAEFTRLAEQIDACRSRLLHWFAGYDAIVCPVEARPARPLHDEPDGAPRYPADYGYTGIYNLTGWPAVVVRAGTSAEGLPIGLQVVAHPWREDVALAVARVIETRLGGWQPHRARTG